jgi:hypothetical protein
VVLMTPYKLERTLVVQKSSRFTFSHCHRRITNILFQMAIEAMSTVHGTDYKPSEIEIGIVSTAPEEDEKTKGLWRTMDEAEIERYLLAYAEKD